MERHLGIYIHIPFCIRKCAYCDFYSVSEPSLCRDYVKALISQISSFRAAAKNYIVDTVYIGGGTPSVLSGEMMAGILSALRTTFRLSEHCEISMEANPGTLDGEKLAAYREAGINRLSIGLQSADDVELKKLSRIHTREEFESSFLLARLEGFDNINVDIMYALPDQTAESLAETISYVVSLDPEHVSFYGLKIEPETPFGKNPAIEQSLPDEDAQCHMYFNSVRTLESAGFHQYEISNFAKPERECRHNLKYWHLEEYLGFGPAAYSFFDGKLFSYVRDVGRYLITPTDSHALFDEMNIPSLEESATQFVMVCFRLRAGIDIAEYVARFRDDFEARYGQKLLPYIKRGYMKKTDKGYALTRRGMLVSNYILSDILEF